MPPCRSGCANGPGGARRCASPADPASGRCRWRQLRLWCRWAPRLAPGGQPRLPLSLPAVLRSSPRLLMLFAGLPRAFSGFRLEDLPAGAPGGRTARGGSSGGARAVPLAGLVDVGKTTVVLGPLAGWKRRTSWGERSAYEPPVPAHNRPPADALAERGDCRAVLEEGDDHRLAHPVHAFVEGVDGALTEEGAQDRGGQGRGAYDVLLVVPGITRDTRTAARCHACVVVRGRLRQTRWAWWRRAWRPWARKAARAAFAPGAPWTPPPGWAAAEAR